MGKSKFNKVKMRFRCGHPERLDDLLTLTDDLLTLTNDQLKWIDVARINLLCATDLPGAEHVDNTYIIHITRTLDLWAKRVEFETNRHLYRIHHPHYIKQYAGSEARLRLEMLCQTLQEDFGVRYNPARIHDPDFSNAKDIFIHDMIADPNGGTCTSMPVLYVAIARRLGYPLRLISAKGHFFCRWRDKRETVNFDGSCNGGCAFHPDDHYRRWPYPISDEEIKAGHYLKPHTPAQELAAFMAARGHCLEEHPRLDETIHAYEQAVRLDPNNPNYRGFLRLMLRKKHVTVEVMEPPEPENRPHPMAVSPFPPVPAIPHPMFPQQLPGRHPWMPPSFPQHPLVHHPFSNQPGVSGTPGVPPKKNPF